MPFSSISGNLRRGAWWIPLLLVSTTVTISQAATTSIRQAPSHLQCESMTTPLGLDTAAPRFTWRLEDTRQGARQSAYEIQIATTAASAASDKADVWDSGRVNSDQSVLVSYGGPALRPEQRYYWRVKAWDKDGNAYPASAVTWWDTGLMQDGWQAQWIGYELPEHRAIRESGARWISNAAQGFTAAGDTRHDFRLRFPLDGPVKAARLYVTGENTAAAWVNGRQVLIASPLPPYRQTPWRKYVVRDVSADVRTGSNVIAVEITHYDLDGNPKHENRSQAPMSACLYIEKRDGSVVSLKSGPRWKAALNAVGNWQGAEFNDASWADAVPTEDQGQPWPTGPVKMLRRAFAVHGGLRDARLYATALGAYTFWINGKRVGDQILAPGWTDFRERVAYQEYDVTDAVTGGHNAIGAYLAPGWYSTPLQWDQQGNNYGKTPPALRAELRLEYADGTVQWVNTDASWKAAVSPIEKAEIYDGENYDARREQPGWSTPRFDDAAWASAVEIHPAAVTIVAQDYQPIRVEKVMHAKAVTEPQHGVYVLDFGQNMAAIPVLHVAGPAGTTIRLRFAEVLNPDGSIYTDNLRTAKATDYYTLAGHGVEEYAPEFTFHGFRYVEITGLTAKPALDIVTARVLHTSAPITATFTSGNAMLNQLWSNILWGQRSNFVGVPTDCPQRDERLGWAGDAEVFWRTASYNMNLAQFSKKYAADLRGTQVGTPMYGIFAPGTVAENAGHSAGWSDAGVIVPWTSWLQSGDRRIIDQNWDAMTKYLDAIEKDNPDYLWANNAGIGFGDWLAPTVQTRPVLVQTAYWAYDITLMREMAHATGRTTDEEKYAALFAKIQQAFAKEFVRPAGTIAGADKAAHNFGVFSPEKSATEDTQTGYVLALNMHLVPDALRGKAAEHLVKKIEENQWRLGTGFLGTPYLLPVLTDTGHADVAYRLLLTTEYPSWGYQVEHGATTMWERWNGDQMMHDPSMNSFNHYAYGAVADWIYRYAAGVDVRATDAGFHTIYLHPSFDARLGSLSFAYESPYGEIRSAWTMRNGDTHWELTVPANAQAVLPLGSAAAQRWRLDGAPLSKSARLHAADDDSGTIYTLPAGRYSFEISASR